MSDEIHDALLRRALGFDCEETVDEYGFSEGEEVLVKRKVTKKYVPPDISAAKLLLEEKPLGEYSDEELAREKERLLKSEENPTISQTRFLLETLEAAPEFLDTFDEELFREIVDKIIVESNERLRFLLINGLELTEDIERTVR